MACWPDPRVENTRDERETLTSSPWWENPDALLDRFARRIDVARVCDWYRVVDALLGIESEDRRFRTRFAELYGELVSSLSEVPGAQKLHCRVQVLDGESAHLVTFTAPEEVGTVEFIKDVYRDRGYVETRGTSAGWRCVGLAGSEGPLLAAKGSHVFVSASQPWQDLIAACATNWVMRMQRDLLFFHAATVGVGNDGVVIAGEKGTGKSTLSIALGALGHKFLGDEIAAVRSRTLELCPFPRAVSIRPGPQSRRLEQLLRERPIVAERFPDGTTRRRAMPRELFPNQDRGPVRLRWAFFLRDFEQTPRAEEFTPRTSDIGLLAPLPGTCWGVSRAQLLLRVAQLFSSVKCCFLHLGLPDETARLVERIVRTE